jgi:hypothetical protein
MFEKKLQSSGEPQHENTVLRNTVTSIILFLNKQGIAEPLQLPESIGSAQIQFASDFSHFAFLPVNFPQYA